MADIAPVTRAQPLVVPLPAEIDLTNARRTRRQLYAGLASGAAVVIADMTVTRFCDSQGLRAVVLAHKRAAECDADLRVVVTSDAVLRVMAITKLDTVLRIYPSVDAALEARPVENDQHGAAAPVLNWTRPP